MIRQFEITQKCPLPTPDVPIEWPLPICVWITLEKPLDTLRCRATAYRVIVEQGATGADGSTYSIQAQPGYTPTVCEHMGRIIE